MKKSIFLLIALLFGHSTIFSQFEIRKPAEDYLKSVKAKAAEKGLCFSDSLFSRSNSAEKGVVKVDGVYDSSKTWLAGQRIKVKFLDGDSFVRSKVEQYAREWEKYANIKFVFVTSGTADIRVSFDVQKGSSWSFVGKESQMYSVRRSGDGIEYYSGNDGASMSFGWFDSKTSEGDFRGTTLHEFGHALGLLHEHQNVNRTFEWNVNAVLSRYSRLYGWSREKIYQDVINPYANNTAITNSTYDKDSIMHYSIPANLTKSGFSVGNNTQLSAQDKRIIREMYPSDEEPESSFTINGIDMEHNVSQNNKKGMKIFMDFTIKGEYQQPHRMAVYFYYADGRPLKDTNNKFASKDGNVAIGKTFTPRFESSRFERFTFFIPYAELEAECGRHKLKFRFQVRKEGKIVARSGYSYITLKRPCED